MASTHFCRPVTNFATTFPQSTFEGKTRCRGRSPPCLDFTRFCQQAAILIHNGSFLPRFPPQLFQTSDPFYLQIQLVSLDIHFAENFPSHFESLTSELPHFRISSPENFPHLRVACPVLCVVVIIFKFVFPTSVAHHKPLESEQSRRAVSCSYFSQESLVMSHYLIR